MGHAVPLANSCGSPSRSDRLRFGPLVPEPRYIAPQLLQQPTTDGPSPFAVLLPDPSRERKHLWGKLATDRKTQDRPRAGLLPQGRDLCSGTLQEPAEKIKRTMSDLPPPNDPRRYFGTVGVAILYASLWATGGTVVGVILDSIGAPSGVLQACIIVPGSIAFLYALGKQESDSK